MDPPAFRTTPLSTLRKASPSAEKRNRRAIQETHAAAREMADYWAQFSRTTVQGTDGNTYEVEAIRKSSSSASRAPWSIAFTANGISLAIPLCRFTSISGNSPDITINGQTADYVDASKNVLPIGGGVVHLFLELSVNDALAAEMDTTAVRVVALSNSQTPNTLTTRYIPINSVNATTKQIGSPTLTTGIQTFRRGDRENVNNLVVLRF